jgi:hypothetical protein
VTSDAQWLTVTSGASGSGNGTFGLSLQANTTTSPRTAHVTINEQIFPVLQAAAVCSFTLGGSSLAAPMSGGTGTLGFTALAPTCPWTATSNAAWLTITSATSGTGSGSIAYNVATNTGADARVGIDVLGALPAIRDASTSDVRGWLVASARVGVGF